MISREATAAALVSGAVVLWACSATSETASSQPGLAPQPSYEWFLPRGFPRPRVPADNPMSAAKVELGRHLFYDHSLSDAGHASCATCHQQELAFTDGLPRSIGATGEDHPRGAMSLANVAYNLAFAWADPTLHSLEGQALVPMFNRDPVELGVEGDGSAMLERLRQAPDYERAFAAAFPDATERITLDTVVKAIAAFQRTLISGDSAYDRRVFHDEASAMSAAAERGMDLFFSESLGCFRCHGGFNFSGPVTFEGAPERESGAQKNDFHNTGLYNLGKAGLYPTTNPGLREHTSRKRDDGRFRAPTLRNVALTAPYMHDGSIATLEGVVEHYAAGGRTVTSGPYAGVGRDNPRKSPLVSGFELDDGQKADLVEFLRALTDEGFVTDPRFADPFDPGPSSIPGLPVLPDALDPAESNRLVSGS